MIFKSSLACGCLPLKDHYLVVVFSLQKERMTEWKELRSLLLCHLVASGDRKLSTYHKKSAPAWPLAWRPFGVFDV